MDILEICKYIKPYLLVQNYYLISYEKKTFHAFAQCKVLKLHFIEKYTDNYICSPKYN